MARSTLIIIDVNQNVNLLRCSRRAHTRPIFASIDSTTPAKATLSRLSVHFVSVFDMVCSGAKRRAAMVEFSADGVLRFDAGALIKSDLLSQPATACRFPAAPKRSANTNPSPLRRRPRAHLLA